MIYRKITGPFKLEFIQNTCRSNCRFDKSADGFQGIRIQIIFIGPTLFKVVGVLFGKEPVL